MPEDFFIHFFNNSKFVGRKTTENYDFLKINCNNFDKILLAFSLQSPKQNIFVANFTTILVHEYQ